MCSVEVSPPLPCRPVLATGLVVHPVFFPPFLSNPKILASLVTSALRRDKP
jgi:hypothetical protein